MNKHIAYFLLGVATWLGGQCSTARAENSTNDRPMLAIWCDSECRMDSNPPYLRIAIWNDGRVIFAAGTNGWNHDLREGHIDTARVAKLKSALEATGVFDLKGTCYLVPDAPVDCVLVDVGTKRQMLFWDEVESPNYGINIDPTPAHLEFKKCWKEVNRLALESIPKDSKPREGKFKAVPQSWRLKRPIQSR